MIKMLFLTMTLSLGNGNVGLSFNVKELQKVDTIYSSIDVDKSPEPEKGMKELYKKWSSGVKYPADARRNGIEGKVLIYFIVDETGEIMKSGIEEGIGYGCDEEALEGFKRTNLKWRPGTKDGRNVKVKMVIPFTFKLG